MRAKTYLLEALKIAAIFAVVYVGNRFVQTYLGQQSLAELNMPGTAFEQAVQQAKAEGKPVLAQFSAIWCPSCRKFDSDVLATDAVKQRIDDAYVFTRLEYEDSDDKAVFEQFGVNGFPSLLVIYPSGEASRLPLTFNPQQFLQLL